ncbi:hypothetical protein JR728_003737 [Vibrio vulnificus]|nr:hypothetical protein [Vibrio vulnificus]
MVMSKETSAAKEKPPTKATGPNSLVPFGALILSLVSILGVGYVFMNSATTGQLGQVVKAVDKKITNATTEFSQSQSLAPEMLETLKVQVATSVQSSIGEKIDQRIQTVVQRSINDSELKFDDKINSLKSAPNGGLDDKRVKAIVDAEVIKLEQKYSKSEVRLNNRIDQTHNDLTNLTLRIDNFEQIANNAKLAGSSIQIRKRLKEFNIVLPTLKDGTLFVIDAPAKDGKVNSITLVKGESFRSKLGRHTVEDIQQTQDGPRLLISGGYYIDEKREEFSKEELESMKPTAQKTTPPAQRIPQAKKSKPVALDDTYLQLSGWYVVTTMPATHEVVVYNPESNMPMRLSKNMFVSGIGTVKSIDFNSGRTCFEKYCINGLDL